MDKDEYIRQLEKENRELKSRTGNNSESNEYYIKHESEETDPKYWKLKSEYEKDMMDFRLKRTVWLFIGLVLFSLLLMFIICKI